MAQVQNGTVDLKAEAQKNEALQQRMLDELERHFLDGYNEMNKPIRNPLIGTLIAGPFILGLSLICFEKHPLLHPLGPIGVVSFYKAFKDSENENMKNKLPAIYRHFKAIEDNIRVNRFDTIERGKALKSKIAEALADCEKKYESLQKQPQKSKSKN